MLSPLEGPQCGVTGMAVLGTIPWGVNSLSVPHHDLTHSGARKCYCGTRGGGSSCRLVSMKRTDSAGSQQKTDGTGRQAKLKELSEGAIYRAVGGQDERKPTGTVTHWRATAISGPEGRQGVVMAASLWLCRQEVATRPP